MPVSVSLLKKKEFIAPFQHNQITLAGKRMFICDWTAFCRERGARALEERLAAERLGAAQGTEESGRDATESV